MKLLALDGYEVFESTNGTSWAKVSDLFSPAGKTNPSGQKLANKGGTWLASGAWQDADNWTRHHLYRSTDNGATWTKVYDVPGVSYVTGFAHLNGRWFVGIGHNNDGFGYAYSDDDGLTWTANYLSTSTGQDPGAIAADESTGVVLMTAYTTGSQAVIVVRTSSDGGASWQSHSSSAYGTSRDAVAGGGYFVIAVGEWLSSGGAEPDAAYLSSSSPGSPSTAAATAESMRAIAYGGGRWVMVGDYDVVKTATSPGSWTTARSRVYNGNYNLFSVVYADGQWFASRNDGMMLASANGTSWYDAANVGRSFNAMTAATNQPPAAPTLLGPIGEAVIDRANTNRFSWQPNDPDVGDSQSAAEVQYWDLDAAGARIGAATVVSVGSPSPYWDAPGGTFTPGRKEWQARTADAQGEWGPWSPSEFVVAADAPPTPTIVDPINGATIPSESYEVEWSTPSQSHYQVQVLDEGDAVVADTGTVSSTTARARVMPYPDNNTTRTTRARIKLDGLWSDWASVTNPVSYTPPAVAGVVVSAQPEPPSLLVAITNPAPVGDQPAAVSHDVWVREAGNDATRRRVAAGVAAGSLFEYRFPTHGVEYEAQVVTYGDNDTSSVSPWVA